MATFLEAQDAALHDDFNATKYRDWAKRFINEAIGLIYSQTTLARGDITLTATVGPGDAIEDFAQEGVLIRSVTRADTGDELDYMERTDFEALANELGSSNTGPPAVYTVTSTGSPTSNSTRIQILPIADGTYTLDVVARYSPTQMSGDSDVAPLPPTYQWFPVRYARSKLFALEDDDRMSAFWMGEWVLGLAAIKADLQRRYIGPRVTPSMWDSLDRGPRFHHPQGLF
jgi:hypothetical protein